MKRGYGAVSQANLRPPPPLELFWKSGHRFGIISQMNTCRGGSTQASEVISLSQTCQTRLAQQRTDWTLKLTKSQLAPPHKYPESNVSAPQKQCNLNWENCAWTQDQKVKNGFSPFRFFTFWVFHLLDFHLFGFSPFRFRPKQFFTF